MARKVALRALALLVVGLLLAGAGCKPNRGEFGGGSCDAAKRIPVGETSALAVYFSENGEIVGTNAEDMAGTKDNRMCPAPEGSGPGACPPGYCPISIPQLGKTYCRLCP